MRPFVLSAAVLAASWIVGAGSAFADLIADGGFENPSLSSGGLKDYTGGEVIGSAWTVLGNDVLLIQTQYGEPGNGIASFNAEEGSNSLDITGSGNTGSTDGVTQSVATTIGTTYQLSFYVGRAEGTNSYYAAPATIDLSIDGGSSVAYTNSNITAGHVNWEQFTTTFVATGTSTSITFRNGTPSPTAFAGLDNVDLEPLSVPEPSTLALCLVGGVCALGRRWSNRTGARRGDGAKS